MKPRAIATPLAAAGTLGLIGLLGMAAQLPWLIPSLGPSIAIQAASPELPGARPWNVFAGHLLGLACGIAAVHLAGAAGTPSVIEAQALSGPRVGAAVLAVLLSMGAQEVIGARHPPAEATTLLFALGALAADLKTAATVIGGVLLLTVLGETCRRLLRSAAPGV